MPILPSGKPVFAPCLVTLTIAMGAGGCAYRTPPTHVPAAVPLFTSVAIEPAEVTVVDNDGNAVAPETAATVRAEIGEILTEAGKSMLGAASADGAGAVEDAEEGAGRTARVRTRVVISDAETIYTAPYRDGMAAIGVLVYSVAVPFGAVMSRATLSVDLVLESGGRTFHGHGSAKKLGSLYAPARRRALAVALDQALADASAAR